MGKRLFGKFFVILVVLVAALFALTACVDDPPPAEPEDKTSEYLGNLGGVLANTLAMNPEEGFLMDLAANVAWKFASEEKRQYDWSYGLTVKANVFADGDAKQGIAIELRDTLQGVDNSEATLGGGGGKLLFGLYNTPEEDLYLEVANQKYHFSNVAVSTAIKTLLKSNGIDLNFNLKDVEVGNMGGLGELVSSSLPLLAMVTDTVTQNGNDFTIELKFSKIYELIGSLTDMSKLPAVVTDLLPKEMTVKAVLHTDGTVLTGIDVIDAVMTTKDGAGDGTFNMTSKFNLFGAPAESLNIASMVSDELKAVEARKILNIDTHGDILFEAVEKADPAVEGSTDTVKTTRTISWKLVSNFDLFKAMETNFILEDAIFNDNFLHFQLKLDGEPVLDLAFSPATLGTNDLIVGANLKVLLDTALPDVNVMGMGIGTLVSYLLPENYFLPINTKALGYMISGQGGKVEEPLPAQSYYNPAKYEIVGAEPKAAEGAAGIDIGAIIDVIGKLVKLDENKELNIDVAGLLKELKLDESIAGIIGNFTGKGETARFTNTVFNFAKAETEAYDVAADMKKGKYNPDTESYAERVIINETQTGKGSVVSYDVETDEGFLKVYNKSTKAAEVVELDKSKRVTLKELNAWVGSDDYVVQYTGKDLAGNALAHDPTSGLDCSAGITGYIGLDPTKIGVQQTIQVTTGIPGLSVILTLLDTIVNSGGLDLGGLDLAPILETVANLKLGVFEADIILSEADYEVGIYEKNTNKELGAEELPNIVNTGHLQTYEIRAKATYKKNGAYEEDLTETATFSSYSSSDWLKSETNSYQALYIDASEHPMVIVSKGSYSTGVASQGDVTFPICYKGIVFEKVYKFEQPTETTYTLNRQYIEVGSTVDYARLGNDFNLVSTYARDGEEDVTATYKLSSYNWGILEFENYAELTETTKVNVKKPGSFKFIKAGIARFNVRFNGVYMTTVEIPVLPIGGNAAMTDGQFSMKAGAETSDFSGKIAFEFAEGLIVPEAYRKAAVIATVKDNNGVTITGCTVTVNGGEDNTFALTESGAQTADFTISGIPAGTHQVNVQLKVNYDGMSLTIAQTAAIPQYSEFKATAAFEAIAYGGAIPANSLTFTEYGQPNLWKVAFENGKYVLKRAGSDEAIDLSVVLLKPEPGAPVNETGIDEAGKITDYGTLKVSFEYGGRTYEITKGIGGLVESGAFDTFAFGEVIPDGSFVVYAPESSRTYKLKLYGSSSKAYYMESTDRSPQRLACTVKVLDEKGMEIAGGIDAKTGKVVKYGTLKVAFTVDGKTYEYTRAFDGLNKTSGIDTFEAGAVIPTGAFAFRDATNAKRYDLAFLNGAYNFYDGLTAIGTTTITIYDANGNVIEGGISSEGKVSTFASLKVTFVLNETTYEEVYDANIYGENVTLGAVIPDGTAEFVDAANGKTYQLKFADGTYKFYDGTTAVGTTEVALYDANGAPIDGGIAADGKISKGGIVKVKFVLNEKTYEFGYRVEGILVKDSFYTFTVGEKIPDDSIIFADPVSGKTIKLAWKWEWYAFVDEFENEYGSTSVGLYDANGKHLWSPGWGNDTVTGPGTLKVTFTYNGKVYEVSREITAPETPAA